MSPRAREYDNQIRFEFDRDHEIVRYIRFGRDTENGRVVRCSIQYEVEYRGETFAIVRFDNAHDDYHQHMPGIPVPSPERIYLPGVPSSQWVRYAIDQIGSRYTEWDLTVLAPWLRLR